MSPSSIPPPNRPIARPRRVAEAGIGRPGGLLVAALTATVVFGIGHQLLSRQTQEAAPLPPPAPAPPSAPSPTSAMSDAAAPTHADGDTHDGPADISETRDAAAPRPDLAPARAQAEDEDKDARAMPSARKLANGDQEERPADKDLARDAWRRNRPEVSTDGNKSALLIPIKGSIAGAGFRVTNRPHAVIVTLPKAASLITMRLYRVSRDGFRLLWINQAEKDADPNDGTSLKLGLSDLGDPLVEIKDDFVRVTVRRSTEGPPAPEHVPAPKIAPPHEPAPAPRTAAPHDTAAGPKGATTHDTAPAPKGSPAPEHPPSPEHASTPEHAPAAASAPKGAPEHAPAPAPRAASSPERPASEHPAAPEHAPTPKPPARPDAD